MCDEREKTKMGVVTNGKKNGRVAYAKKGKHGSENCLATREETPTEEAFRNRLYNSPSLIASALRCSACTACVHIPWRLPGALNATIGAHTRTVHQHKGRGTHADPCAAPARALGQVRRSGAGRAAPRRQGVVNLAVPKVHAPGAFFRRIRIHFLRRCPTAAAHSAASQAAPHALPLCRCKRRSGVGGGE